MEAIPIQKETKTLTRKIRIKRTYTLTSTKASKEDMDIVMRYFEKTLLDVKGLNAFARVFDVKVEETTPNASTKQDK